MRKYFKDCTTAEEAKDLYRKLAKHIAENEDLVVPNPLGVTELRDWAREWGDKLYAFNDGVVSNAEGL